MDKLAAIQYSSNDILADSHVCNYSKEDGNKTNLSFSDSTSCDSSFSIESDHHELKEKLSTSGRSRLDVFQ